MSAARTRAPAPAAASGPAALQRVKLSFLAVLAGWFAASLATMPFEALELLLNAAPGYGAREFVQGTALWFAFLLGFALAAWVAIVLVVALLVPGPWIVRHRHAIAWNSALLTWLVFAWRLKIYRHILYPGMAESPFKSPPLQLYTVCIVAFALATTFTYSRLLQRSHGSSVEPAVR